MMMNKKKEHHFAVLSDSTGETAENYVRAILALFQMPEAKVTRIPSIRHETVLKQELDKLEKPCLVAYTFATEKLRKIIWSEIRKRHFIGIDVLYPALQIFSDFLKTKPTEEHGALHSTHALNYFERIDAVEFSVKHDDGLHLSELEDAHLILTGVSRTSKTPTSIYLAHKGFKVANVPLIYGVEPPQSIFQANQNGVPVVLLMIDPQSLQQIRRARFERLGTKVGHSDTYVDHHKICEELEASRQLAERHRWPVIDVTNKAVEETASEILLLIHEKN